MVLPTQAKEKPASGRAVPASYPVAKVSSPAPGGLQGIRDQEPMGITFSNLLASSVKGRPVSDRVHPPGNRRTAWTTANHSKVSRKTQQNKDLDILGASLQKRWRIPA